MPTTTEAARLNLEYYRKQAKALLKACRAGDPEAIRRICDRFPEAAADPSKIGLQQAQFVIAQDAGFASWPKLKISIEQSQMTLAEQADSFVCAVCSDDVHRAKTLWVANPAIAGAGVYVALATGDARRVEAHLAGNANFARQKGGPSGWEPLVYVAFSRWGRIDPNGNALLLETARLLLAHGADPNAYHINKFWPDSPLSCLYGASAATNQIELARLLLEAGANPSDGESLYHSTEHKDLASLRLLLAHGARPAGSNALKHMLDREEIEGVRLLLAAGADPNEVNEKNETALHWAVWRGRSPQIVAILLNAGAKMDPQRSDGRTAYQLAVRTGQVETATLLAERGADTRLTAEDELLETILSASGSHGKRTLEEHPGWLDTLGKDSGRLVAEFADNHMTAAVEALLDSGAPVDAPGSVDGATALHWACLNGYADMVKLLLAHGASLTAEDTRFEGTPVGWFAHGVRNDHNKEGDYVATARLLIDAGAVFNSFQIPTGDDEVDAVFREHGLIS